MESWVSGMTGICAIMAAALANILQVATQSNAEFSLVDLID
jgi:hypothetical protein